MELYINLSNSENLGFSLSLHPNYEADQLSELFEMGKCNKLLENIENPVWKMVENNIYGSYFLYIREISYDTCFIKCHIHFKLHRVNTLS